MSKELEQAYLDSARNQMKKLAERSRAGETIEAALDTKAFHRMIKSLVSAMFVAEEDDRFSVQNEGDLMEDLIDSFLFYLQDKLNEHLLRAANVLIGQDKITQLQILQYHTWLTTGRITLDVPETEVQKGEVLRMLTMREKQMKVTVEER